MTKHAAALIIPISVLRAPRLFTCSVCVLLPPGPSMMPGGTPEAYKYIEPIVQKVTICLTVKLAYSTFPCV